MIPEKIGVKESQKQNILKTTSYEGIQNLLSEMCKKAKLKTP